MDMHRVMVSKHSCPSAVALAALKRHIQCWCLVIKDIQVQLLDLENQHKT